MQQPYDPAGSGFSRPPERSGGFRPRSALLTFAFATFVLGGFSFGWLFMANWKLLVSFQMAQVQIPGGPRITVPVAPEIEASRRPAPGLPPVVIPGATPDTTAPERRPEDALRDIPEWQSSKRLNIMLLGIDHREDEPIDGSRSDTIIVVSIDPPSKSVVMLSLPRDLWVSIPGYYPQRINVAHAAGGPALIARTIEANFGIKVDNYARVDFDGFEQVVDAIGGIIIDVERPLKDDEYPTSDYGVTRLYLPPGPMLMDGRTALMYARSRHSEDDFGRSRRQQKTLMAIRDRGLQVDVLPKIFSLAEIAQKSVSTDLGPREMLSLAKLASEIDRERIKSVVIDARYADPFIGNHGEELLMPRRADIQRAILRAFSEAACETARVEVLNGTPRAGVARQVADQLSRAGYDVTRVDDADRTDYVDTTIEVLTNSLQAANVLAARLKLPPTAVKQVPTANPTADVRIIVGRTLQP